MPRLLTTTTVSALLVLACATLASAWPDLSWERLGSYGMSEYDLEHISQGYPDGSWRPDSPLSRAQFAKMAVRQFSLPPALPASPSYRDVPADHQYFADIEAASAAGLLHGRGDGMFDPSGYITRQEAVAIVSRGLANLRGIDPAVHFTDGRIQEVISGFRDGGDVSASLRADVTFAAEEGLVRGAPDGNMSPLARITRIQGAALLVRAGQRRAAFGTPRPYVPTTILHTPTTGSSSARISGTVATADGGGLFGFVSLMNAEGAQLEWAYVVGSPGSPAEYAFEGLAPGDYRLAAYSPDYVSEFYGGLPTQSHTPLDSSLLHIGPDDIRADFVLTQGHSISGHVFWGGLPPETPMTFGPPQGMDPPWFSLDVALYDAAGGRVSARYYQIGAGYVFWGLIPGEYTVMARGVTSGGSDASVWYDAAHSRAEAVPVDISAGDATDIDLYLGVLRLGSTPVTTVPVTTVPVTTVPVTTTMLGTQ